MTVSVNDEEVSRALGVLSNKTPAALKVAVNTTARQTRKLMLTEVKNRYDLNAAGRRMIEDLRQRQRATNRHPTAILAIMKNDPGAFRADLGYFRTSPTKPFMGPSVRNAPPVFQAHVLKGSPMIGLSGTGERSKGFLVQFTDGKPYDEATFTAGRPVAVITESISRALFGSIQSVGKEFLLSHAPYRVVGVVKDVSTLADMAYGQVWIPFTSTNLSNDTWSDNHMGMMSVTLLAHDREDFDEIRAEAKRRMNEYNSILADQGYTLIDRNRPYDQETQSISFAANLEPDLKAARRERVIIFIILLLVPAINLSSMTQSRLRQRVAEIGVRRAFGSTRIEMVGQIVMENLVITLLAGAIGLLISILFAYWGTDILFAQPYSVTLNAPTVDSRILLQPSTFLYALLFCFVLNLLSSGIPAWRASRTNIVNALGGKIH